LARAKIGRIFTEIKVMKLIEKDFVVGGAKCGTFYAYGDVEPELEITPDHPFHHTRTPRPLFL